jgi:3-hydroxybutyryl-CoA dehydratase
MTTASLSSMFTRDFGELKEGTSFVSVRRTITETDVVSFAALTGDWHPLHTDAVWASESRFGERIAHGLLVQSTAVGLIPLDPERVVALRRANTVFKEPVRFGDTIQVEGKIAKVKPLDEEHSMVTCAWKVVNQDGKTVLKAQFDLIWLQANKEQETASVKIPGRDGATA